MCKSNFLVAALAFGISALPDLAEAKNVYLTHFVDRNASACYIRQYDKAHLAKHPDQLVTSVSMSISPINEGGTTPTLNLFITFRGSNSVYQGVGICKFTGDDLTCGVEGDGGSFTLSAKSDTSLLLTVGLGGMGFEGDRDYREISGTKGDDRSFVIPSAPSRYCN